MQPTSACIANSIRCTRQVHAPLSSRTLLISSRTLLVSSCTLLISSHTLLTRTHARATHKTRCPVSSALLFLSSVANLKRLSVNPHCFTLDQLSDYLALCPIITSLRFCTGFVEDGWFSGPGLTTLAQCNEETMALITPSSEEGGGEYLCRCLENFQATTALFTAQTLYNFITARKQQARRGYPSLKTVRVSFDKPQDCDLLDALRDDTEITTANPIAPPPVENYLRSIARYPPYSTTAESRVFHQLDLKLFSLPIS